MDFINKKFPAHCLNHLISPIVLTRTKSIHEVMKEDSIPYYNFSINNLGDKLDCCAVVTTYPMVLDDATGSPRRCI
eukprot:c17159_g1_i1 orf=2-226(-)